jgi:hypothetical protein
VDRDDVKAEVLEECEDAAQMRLVDRRTVDDRFWWGLHDSQLAEITKSVFGAF